MSTTERPIAAPLFEKWEHVRHHYTERQFADRLVITHDEAVSELSPMGPCRYYLDGNLFPDRALCDWRSFVMDMPVATGKHTHQGGLVIYIVEGRGHSVIDGVEESWEAGDLLLLPVRAGGVEHQFFNDRPGEPCRWLSAIHIPMFNQLGSEFTQQDYASEYAAGSDQPADWTPPRMRDAAPEEAAHAPSAGPRPADVAVFENGPARTDALARTNLFDALLWLRDEQRRGWRGRGVSMVAGRHLPWEENAFGRVKWFMHPFIADTCIRTHIVYEVGVRPGERTGLLRHQGNSFCYVLQGEGTTTIDGVEWPWRAGDMIQLPARPPGITLRHSVEPGAPSEARLICFELNTVDQVGIDRGCGYDLLEPAELKG